MSGQARPWWASDGPVDGGVARDEDPVERFRAARRGASGVAATGGSSDADAAPWLEVAAATMSRLARDLAQGASTAGDPAPSGDPASYGREDAEARPRPDRDPDPAGSAPGGQDVDGDGQPATSAARPGADPGAGDGPAVAGSRGDPQRGGEDESSRPPHTPEVCGICPICVGLRTLAEARPELLGHLAEVARHASLAVRSLTERPERGGGTARPEGDGDPLEHIDLD